ncbi:MAG: crosslink repair DNA glycosylase YcaQ family protein, partial [Mariniblastus sp.]
VIQRKRMQALFGFEYLIECYVPAAKRKYGYFCLPILWGGKLVARMDCKVDRAKSELLIQHLALEPTLTNAEAFFVALKKELKGFLKFNGCEYVQLRKTSPAKAKLAFQRQ